MYKVKCKIKLFKIISFERFLFDIQFYIIFKKNLAIIFIIATRALKHTSCLNHSSGFSCLVETNHFHLNFTNAKILNYIRHVIKYQTQ